MCVWVCVCVEGVRVRAIVNSPHTTDKDVTVLQLFPTRQDGRQINVSHSRFYIQAHERRRIERWWWCCGQWPYGVQHLTYSNPLNISNSNANLQKLRKWSNDVLSLFCPHAASHSCSYGYVRQVTTIAESAQSTQAYALATHSRWQHLFYQAATFLVFPKVRGEHILCNCNFAVSRSDH